MFDKIHEECGVFGYYSTSKADVAGTAFSALMALQHRGQESCGIAVNDKGVIKCHKDLGLVSDVFSPDILEQLGNGNIAVGHVRYSTTGEVSKKNAQPLLVRHIKGNMAIAHNGNLTNADTLREKYELSGAQFHGTSDTEVISYALTEERLKTSSIEQAAVNILDKLEGAYSLVISSPQKLIALRDKIGYRPLCIGKTTDGCYAAASESCALHAIGAEFLCNVKPGEVIVIDENGMRRITEKCTERPHMCLFEYIYFSRPDSVIEGVSVQRARINAGKLLWKEHPVQADVVIGVPDSGLDAALGLSYASGIPYDLGFVKNKYVGRTFIKPQQKDRDDSVRVKLNIISDSVKDKKVILVDDSIVRGTTCRRIVKLVREAGAKEIHMRISSPPFISPCYYGTDIDSIQNLIACRMTPQETAEYIGADSLGYLSVENAVKMTENAGCEFCTGCFSGIYPQKPPSDYSKNRLDKNKDYFI